MSCASGSVGAVQLWEWAKSWFVWLVFFLAGPLIGLGSLMAVGTISALIYRAEEWKWFMHDPANWAMKTMQMIVFAYPFALFFGGLPAAFVGIVAARTFVARGRVSLLAVMTASFLAFLGYLAWILLKSPVNHLGTSKISQMITVLALTHLTAGLGCWLLVARLRGRSTGRNISAVKEPTT